jgi:type I restriction enzyme S subunit
MINLNMLTPGFRESQVVPHLKQQCGQANVNGTIMKNMIVAIPPIEEQIRIVAKVDELMALCDALIHRINTAQNFRLVIADAMAEQAFL